ncbi:MAG TPA: PAS domain-containing protein, partial [Gammaproteobacteria bacterium]|nr:PAS domain-containing protein [Gammaproteobacteria bacterium]
MQSISQRGSFNRQVSEESTMSDGQSSSGGSKPSRDTEQVRSALNHVMTPIILVDRDLKITFANEASKALLKAQESNLQKVYPDFKADKVMGACIDQFHKDPKRIRKLLDDPANLPHEADIHIGPLTFKINVTAQMDSKGNYIGSTLQWDDVTAQRANEAQIARLQSSVDGAMTAMMMIDRDLNVTYVNEATRELLKTHEATLREAFPGFRADQVVGACIDMFHKDPAHQRKLLGDPKNLPYSTDIQVGPLTFAINVTAQMDPQGNYIGATLEWSDVTEKRADEERVARLQTAVDGAMTAMMMIDRDLKITYVNQATRELLRKHEKTLREAFPGFDAEQVVGACIDMFHKNPAHQRKLLGDPRNLPYSTDIQVGPLTFAINVTAQIDRRGNYIGSTLEWKDVTELRAQEALNADYRGQIQAISKSQAVIEFNMDGTIITANDNFLKTV